MLIRFWPQNFKGKENLENFGNLQGSSQAHKLKRREIRIFRKQEGIFGFNKSRKYFDQLSLSVFLEKF